jgi:hypothetical protein
MNDLIEFLSRNYAWLGAASALGALISGLIALAAYREARTGFFSLIRETAAMRARRAGLLALVLLFISVALGAAPRLLGPPPTAVRIPTASPTATKARPLPTFPPGVVLASPTPPAVVEAALPVTEITATMTIPVTTEAALVPTIVARPGGTFGSLVFSRGVKPGNQPAEAGQSFPAGDSPIYAFFAYAGMNNDQVWTQVWSRDGQEIQRQQAAWRWGAQGIAYVFFKPTDGYTPGTYQVQLFIGDQLASSGQFVIQ